MNTGAALQGVIALGAVMLELNLFTNKTNPKKMTGLISMVLSLNLLVRAVRNVGTLNTKTILKGILGLGGIMAAFAVLINSTKGLNLTSSIPSLLVMAGSIILFIEAFKQVEGMDSDAMVKFAASLAMMLLSLSVAIKIISSIPIIGALTGLANFAIFIVGVGAIIVALGALQNAWGGLTGFLESGGNILGQIGTALGKFVGGIGKGLILGMDLPQIGTDLSSFMTNVQGFIDGAKNIDSGAIDGAKNLVSVIGAIAGSEFKSWLVTLFSRENPVTKFSNDIVTLGQSLTQYALAVLPIALVPKTVLDRSVSVAIALAGVARQIPATGGIVGLINGIGDLNTFSTNIKSLGTGLTNFAMEISAIDDSKFNQTKIDAIVSVASGLASLESDLEGQGGLEDAIEGVKSLSKFSDGMKPFGEGLNTFITEVAKIEYSSDDDNEKLYAVIDIGIALAKLENSIQAQGGWVDAIEGVKSLSRFSEGMLPFANGLNSFITEVKKIEYDSELDNEKLYAVIDIGIALAKLENSIQAQGGWVDAIEGVKSLSAFGGEMPDFATGLNNFITQVSTLEDDKYDATKIENALAVASAINELNHALPSTDGWIQGIIGTQDLGLFSDNIKKVGEALASFSSNVAGATVDKAEDAVTALDVIRSFTSTLKTEGGLWDDIGEFFGGSQENTLLGYAANMRKVGEDLNVFSTHIEDVEIGNIEKASSVVEAIRDFIETLSASGGVLEVLGGFFSGNKAKTLDSMSTQMGKFGTEMGKLAAGITNIDATSTNFESAKTLFDNFKTFYEAAEGAEEIDYTGNLNELLRVLDEFGSSLAAFGTNLGNTDVSSLASASSIIQTLVNLAASASDIDPANVQMVGQILEEYGKISMSGFVMGFSSATGDAVLAVNGLISQITIAIQNDTTVAAASVTLSNSGVTAIRGTWFNWYSAGGYLGRGISAGISGAASSIRNAAVSAASGAIRAIRITWSIHSPSKVGEELGRFWDLGIAGGIDKYGFLVSRSASDVGVDAIHSAESVLNRLSYMTDNMESDPTIRPVMDMTDVLNGFQMIDGLFSAERMIQGGYFSGLTGIRSARALANEPGSITATTDNKDVVEELKVMSKQFEELSVAVKNMQIVLDTGVVAGSITEKVDANLGTLTTRRGRGN